MSPNSRPIMPGTPSSFSFGAPAPPNQALPAPSLFAPVNTDQIPPAPSIFAVNNNDQASPAPSLFGVNTNQALPAKSLFGSFAVNTSQVSLGTPLFKDIGEHQPAVNKPVVNKPAVKEPAFSKPAVIEPTKQTLFSPTVDDGTKGNCDQDTSRHFNNKRFSDLKIKFGNREFHAHRFVLCEKSQYFDKLCGPDSSFVGAKEKELTLRDDDPDAVWAMFRHFYNFWLRPPRLDLAAEEKVYFYCNVVVVSDRYNIPDLAKEARKSLNTFVVSLKKPEDLLTCLRIITDEYSNYRSLDKCATNLAYPRLSELAPLAGFPGWLATQPQFLRSIVEDAAKLRARPTPLPTLPVPKYKAVPRFKCATPTCTRILLPDANFPTTRCHGKPGVANGFLYEEY